MISDPTTILLATDGSSQAANARLAAADISSRSGASVHLVSAWQRRTSLLSLPQETSRSHVSSMLAHERQLACAAGAAVTATHSPEGGWPAGQILSVARHGRGLHDLGIDHLDDRGGAAQRPSEVPRQEVCPDAVITLSR
jgi:nucleotide-binding universal stress UspA family protein